MQSVYLSAEQLSEQKQLRFFNHLIEQSSLNQLAEKAKSVGSMLGHNVKINSIEKLWSGERRALL